MLHSLQKLYKLLTRAARIRAFWLCVLLVVNGFAEMLSIGLLLPLFNLAIGGEATSDLERSLRSMTEAAGLTSNGNLGLILIIGFGIVFLLRNMLLAGVQYCLYRFIWVSRTELTCLFHRSYLALPYTFHLSRSTSAIVRNLTISLQDVFTGMLLPLVLLISEMIIVVAIGALMLMASPSVTLGIAVALGLVVVFIHYFSTHRLKAWGRVGTVTNQQMIQAATQALHAVKEIKVSHREAYFEKKFQAIMAANSWAKQWSNTANQFPRLIMETLAVWGGLAAIGLAAAGGQNLAESLPMLAMFAVAALRLIPSFSRINQHLNNLHFNQATLDDLYADLTAFKKAEAARAQHAPTGQRLTPTRDIRLEGVGFQYQDSAWAAVDQASLTIERGQCVAFVGPTGSGKSTLINLLLGLLEPTTGSILIDGHDVRHRVRDWQASLAVIPQDVVVLEGTVRENITFGLDDGDQARLDRAIAIAQLGPVLARLPQGVDSLVGERGLQFSGGERQRIGIARALYNDADVLVMDEATSALDARTEADIAQAIDALRGERTVIVIAHRLSSVRNCDTLFFMKDGRVVASGNFEQLVENCPDFADMVDQMSVDLNGGVA